MADRIASVFARCREEGRAALVGYLTAGDPDPETSEAALLALAGRVDVLEIGMPFSDPMADGPVIQLASERALAAGTRTEGVFRLAAKVRAEYPELAIVLMGYGNTPYHLGYDRFAEFAAEAGVDGVLLVDIPPEESGEFDAALRSRGILPIRLLAPTSPEARVRRAAETGDGFIYFVSLTGVTGAGMGDVDEIADHVAQIRDLCDLPVCVGFGIKSPEQAVAVAEVADGVVVGSHFVTQIAEHAGERSAMLGAIERAAGEIRAALAKGGRD